MAVFRVLADIVLFPSAMALVTLAVLADADPEGRGYRLGRNLFIGALACVAGAIGVWWL